MGRVTIPQEAYLQSQGPAAEQSRVWCRQLEEGNILFFPQTPIALAEDDLRFLLTLEQTSSGLHKNLAYKPQRDEVSGADMKRRRPCRKRTSASHSSRLFSLGHRIPEILPVALSIVLATGLRQFPSTGRARPRPATAPSQ